MKLSVCRHQLGALAEGQRRQEPHDELMGVLRQRDALGRIVQEPCEPAPHLIGLCKREIPHVVDMLGSIEPRDRKSTRLNSSHSQISYAVFCLKKKKKPPRMSRT